MFTNEKIKSWLEEGINVVLSPDGDFAILCEDGSVRNNQNCIAMHPDTYRASLYAAYKGNAGKSVAENADMLNALASNCIYLAGGVAAEAPDATEYTADDLYFNTTDHKLYKKGTSAWADNSTALASGVIYVTDDGLYKYDSENYMTAL